MRPRVKYGRSLRMNLTSSQYYRLTKSKQFVTNRYPKPKKGEEVDLSTLLLMEWTPEMGTLINPPRSKTKEFGVTMINWWELTPEARQSLLASRKSYLVTGNITLQMIKIVVGETRITLKEAELIIRQLMDWLDLLSEKHIIYSPKEK